MVQHGGGFALILLVNNLPALFAQKKAIQFSVQMFIIWMMTRAITQEVTLLLGAIAATAKRRVEISSKSPVTKLIPTAMGLNTRIRTWIF